jgi:DNA-binding GntR family transcriptional regulator
MEWLNLPNHIENKPLREQILEILCDAIVNGDIRPGQALVEADLATQLGVSRAPVREALQILNRDGLLETVPYHGTTVRKLTRTDIEELYSLRSVLESFAIRRVIALDNPADVLRLRECFQVMLTAAEADDLKQLNEADRNFHDAIIECSNHRMLWSVWRGVSLQVRQVMALRNMRFSELKDIAYNHLAIIEAIAEGNETQAVELIQAHVASVGDQMAEVWDIMSEDEKAEND